MIFAAAAGTPIYLDATFWVAVCVVLFLGFLVYKGVHKAIGTSLDGRAEKIQSELDEARRLREEAQAMLASFHRKQKEAEERAQGIIERAKQDADLMASHARQQLGERLERRAAMAEAKIASAEAKAVADVRAQAANLAIAAAETFLRDGLTAAQHNQLIKDGISDISKTLNS